jgi:arsenate reductase-like glutaredoxin family protein
MISKDNKQINLYYHPNHRLAKKCIAIANANKAKVLAIDISRTRVSQTDWSEIARLLDISVVELVDLEHDFILSKFGKTPDVDEFSALKLIQNNPEVVKAPVALRKEKVVVANTARDILKLQDADTGEIRIP